MLDGIQPPKNYPTDYFHPALPPQKPKTRRRVIIFILTLLAVSIILVGGRAISLAKKVFDKSTNPIAAFGRLLMSGDKPLQGEEEGEIRILLMGMGGEGHEGPNLTDTMILATLRPARDGRESKLNLVSIPRDFNAYIPGQDFRKINSAYAYGELAKAGAGARLASQTVERIVGESIPYYAVIDFKGFEKVIDDLGGITVNVNPGFTDSQFPDEKLGFLPPVVFEAGEQKMDGARALQYVRSRHGTNGQNSDFARSHRQQQVLEAIWDKSNDFRVVTNLGLLNRVLGSLADNFHTNLEPYEIKRLYGLAKDIKKENVTSLSIDQDSGLVCSEIAPETGAYILLPCHGLTNYEAIREVLKNQFLTGGLAAEHPSIEIQNASTVEALGKRIQDLLNLPGITFTLGNFRGQAVYNETIIYDNTKGVKKETLNYLKEKLGARVAGGIFPFPTAEKDPDFVIVVTP